METALLGVVTASLLQVVIGFRVQFSVPGIQTGISANFGGFSSNFFTSQVASSGGGGSYSTSDRLHRPDLPDDFSSPQSAGAGFSRVVDGNFENSPSSSGSEWSWPNENSRAVASADVHPSSSGGDSSGGQETWWASGHAHRASEAAQTPTAYAGTNSSEGNGEPANQADSWRPPTTISPEEEGAGGFAAWTSFKVPLTVVGAPQLSGTRLLFGSPLLGEGIVFNLFTRKEPSSVRLLYQDTSTIRGSSYNPYSQTKIIVHGFTSNNKPKSGGHLVKDALLKVSDVNVILVDWSGVDPHIYPIDVKSTVPMVGTEIAELIKTLQTEVGAHLDDMHIIGHSLGSHIAGAAGSLVLGPVGLGRITGLDPAGPLFEGADAAHRLDPSDAGFVEAIHTDAGMLGISQTVGHVDFFVDGGTHPNPSCGPDLAGLCTHCFAYEVYAYAIENEAALVGVKCEIRDNVQRGGCRGEKTSLGLNANRRDRGVFFLESIEKPSGELKAVGEGSVAAVIGLIRMRLPSPDMSQDPLIQC